MAVVDAPLCPSDNDPHTYYSAPPAVYFGSTTYHSFPPKRNTLVSTHVHCSFTQFSWENTVQATAWKHEWKRAWVMHKTLRWTICTYAFGVYLISADSLLRCCSALLCFGACRWKLHAHSAVDAASCANVVARRVYMSETTFREWVEIKDGRGCSEEVVAKGKGHARKTGRRRRGRAHRRPIREQSVSSVNPPSPPVQWSGTALPPMGVSWVWQGTVCAWHVALGLQVFDSLILVIIVGGRKYEAGCLSGSYNN